MAKEASFTWSKDQDRPDAYSRGNFYKFELPRFQVEHADTARLHVPAAQCAGVDQARGPYGCVLPHMRVAFENVIVLARMGQRFNLPGDMPVRHSQARAIHFAAVDCPGIALRVLFEKHVTNLSGG